MSQQSTVSAMLSIIDFQTTVIPFGTGSTSPGCGARAGAQRAWGWAAFVGVPLVAVVCWLPGLAHAQVEGLAPASEDASSTPPSQDVATDPQSAPHAPDAPADVSSDAPAVDPLLDSPLQLLPVAPPTDGGLTAARVATLAVATSPRARTARADQERASDRAGEAYSLFLPRVDLTASYTRLSRVPKVDFSAFAGAGMGLPMSGDNDDPFGLNLLDRYVLQAAVRVPISEYLLNLREHYDNAQQMETVGKHQRAGEEQAVVHEAKQSYYELARAVAAYNLASHRVRQLARFTAEIRTLVEGGELSQVELAQARSREASAQAAMHRALAAQRIAGQTLRRQVGWERDAPLAVGEPLLDDRPAPPEDLKNLLANAQEQRPEAQALRALILARIDNRDAVAFTQLPKISLFGNVNVDSPNQRLFPPQQKFFTTWAVGVELAWSPTEFITAGSAVNDSDLEVARARQDLRALYDRIAVEVTTAYENALAAEGAVEAAEVAAVAAQETLDARMALFRAGEATSREVLDAELDLRVAQLDFVDNVLSTHLARAALDHATGRALQEEPQAQ